MAEARYLCLMHKMAPHPSREDWYVSKAADAQPEPGYDEWLAEEIANARAQIRAGEGVPAEQVWKDLGLE